MVKSSSVLRGHATALAAACLTCAAHAQVTINTTNQTITGDTDFTVFIAAYRLLVCP